MDDETVAKKLKGRREKIQKAAELHARKNEERAKSVAQTKSYYQTERGGPILTDLLQKANLYLKYHQKIAQDGVGARKTGFKLKDGTEEVENYFLTQAERCAHLDKAAGIQEILDYIERMTATAVPDPQQPTAEAESTDETIDDVADEA